MFSASIHRCDATAATPYCSLCGCYQPLDASLFVSKTLLTLKHDNQATIAIAHPNSPLESFLDGTIQIRRVGEEDWSTLGPESLTAPWTARIAGHFELRGLARAGGHDIATDPVRIEVQFPSVEQIAADPAVIEAADAAWAATTDACTRLPNRRQEFGFAIRLNTTNDTYVCDELVEGPPTMPWDVAEIYIPVDPYNAPDFPTSVDSGAVYYVADLHTHTSPVNLEDWIQVKPVGVSSKDFSVAQQRGAPGIVRDYVAEPGLENAIQPGWPLDAPSQLYFATPPSRRSTPNPPNIP